MENELDIFELDFKDGKIRVQRHFVSNQTIYRVIFQIKEALWLLPGRLLIMLPIVGHPYLKAGKEKRKKSGH